MADPLRVLFVTSEAHPLIKTGGLGDVGGALPLALRQVGVDARLLLPAYPGTIEKINAEPLGPPLRVLRGLLPVRLFHGRLPDGQTPVYLIDAPPLYHRSSPYVDTAGQDWPDNALRFGVLSKTAAWFALEARFLGWKPQLVHCNDWQTGLAPAYLAYASARPVRSMMGVHNMAFQGSFAANLLPHLELPRSSFDVEGLEFYGRLSFLKAGLYYADRIVAVSPTYAREIQTSEFGCGMEGLLARRKPQLTGILNGVDTTCWDPARDPFLPAAYSSANLQGKAANKRALQQRFGLETDPGIPLLGIVSRLTQQKGIDLVLGIARRLLGQPAQIVVLGSGDKALESELQQLPQELPGAAGVYIGYNEKLSHLIEAGCDIFLMPSRFEPCGLNQMYSMLYGSPPVVRRTGGLADTVTDSTPRSLAEGTATGFVFAGDNQDELLACVLRALRLFQNGEAWGQLQRNGMCQEFSWRRSAERYAALYRSLIPGGPDNR